MTVRSGGQREMARDNSAGLRNLDQYFVSLPTQRRTPVPNPGVFDL
jgi:hypothetical protein